MRKVTEHNIKSADLLLLILYIILAAIILFRINIESTGYLSPDSKNYLQLAQNLKDGHGFYVPNNCNSGRHYFSTWPVGYPILIYLFSEVSILDVYWASKTINLLLLAAGFLLLRHIFRPYSFVIASIYSSYTFMEVYSFTWSEAPFILGLLVLAYLANQIWSGRSINRNILLLFLTCLTLFLFRYVGLFSFGVPALLGLYFGYNRNYVVGFKLLIATIILTALAATYLYTNYMLSGFTTGFDRLAAETESSESFALMLSQGLINEFFIIRKFRLSNQPDYLFYATAILQLLALSYVSITVRKHYNFWQKLKNHSFAAICLLIASLYFVSILALRLVSHFDDLDYRLLSPFSFLAFIALIYTLVSLPDTNKGVVKSKYVVFLFFVISLFLNMPKNYMLSVVQQFIY